MRSNRHRLKNRSVKVPSPVLTLLLLCGIRVTAVIFKHIHLPVCECLSVYFDLLHWGAGVASARVRSHIPVDAQLKASVVQVACQLADSSWKPEGAMSNTHAKKKTPEIIFVTV